MKFIQLKWVLILILALVIVISGCSGELSAKIGDTVKVHYTGTLDNGTVFDSSYDRGEPLEFTIGKGELLPDFEEAVTGMKVGQSKAVNIPVEDAYGPYREELVVVEDRDDFSPDLELEIGLQLQVQTQDGQIITFTVVDFSDSTVTLDYNHSLAGEDLTFEIELVEIL